MAKKAIDQAAWLKLTIDEKKANLKRTMTKTKSEMPLGVKILGASFMEAFNFYANLGEFYFSMREKNKGILPAVKECNIIAAENLK